MDIHNVCMYLLCASIYSTFASSVVTLVSVTTKVGTFNGYTREFEAFGERRKVEKYLGIPYAKAPIGERRFQNSELKEDLRESYNATEFGPACVGLPFPSAGVIRTTNKVTYSEDCLFLNIFAPERVSRTFAEGERRAVIVYLHGGGFNKGFANSYVGDTISAVGHVVVVTLNYRLAVWGFLSTGDEHMRGNYGLWDQHIALQWIHNNIADFGGDPDRVTLVGQSAGGASVIFQSLYPANRGLFQRGIAMSGSITCPWAFNANPLAAARHLAVSLGCTVVMDTSEIFSCIKSKSTEEINEVLHDGFIKFPLDFLPVVDGEFIQETPDAILSGTSDTSSAGRENFSTLDFMTGNTDSEGLMHVTPFVGARNFEDFTVSRERLENKLIPEAIRIMYGDDVPTVVKEIIISEYTDWSDADDILKSRDSFIKIASDYVFKIHIGKPLALHAKSSNKNTYVYNFDALPSQHRSAVPTWTQKPAHGDELTFMFGYDSEAGYTMWTNPYTDPFRPPQWELDLSKAFITMVTNYAKSGNPNEPEDIEYVTGIGTRWPTYDLEKQRYYNISRGMAAPVGRALYAKEEYFWDTLIPSVIQWNLSKGPQGVQSGEIPL